MSAAIPRENNKDPRLMEFRTFEEEGAQMTGCSIYCWNKEGPAKMCKFINSIDPQLELKFSAGRKIVTFTTSNERFLKVFNAVVGLNLNSTVLDVTTK